MRIARAATVALEIAHRGTDGVLHGHSLTVEVWTGDEVCLDEWKLRVASALAHMEGELERTIGNRTFEGVAQAVLRAIPEAHRVVVRLPSRGHAVECEDWPER